MLKEGLAGLRKKKEGEAFRCQIRCYGVGVACYCLHGSDLDHANYDDDDSNSLYHKDLSLLLYKVLYIETKCVPRVGPCMKMREGEFVL